MLHCKGAPHCVLIHSGMGRTIIAGPMATAASVLGATEPTARPRDADAKDSNVRIPRNFANLGPVTNVTASRRRNTLV